MRTYTFVVEKKDREHIEAMSLKKAIKKYNGGDEKKVLVLWKSRKGNESMKLFKLPIKTRAERKGR